MTFTESDASNDGLIKREVGKQMAKVAKTQNPQLFEHFQRVCDEIGRSPADVFGEMAVRALNSEHYAEEVLSSEVNMGQIKADEIRMEDVRYVKELSEELGLNDTQQKKDPIDELINQRIENVTKSPLENMTKSKEDPSGVDGRVLDHMESLQNEINRLQQKIEGNEDAEKAANQTTEHNEQSVDDLFGGSNETEEQSDETDRNAGTVVEVEPEPDEETAEVEPEPEDEGPTEEEIEEAMEGTVASVDDATDEEVSEAIEEEIDIPTDDEDDNPFVTSEDGEEE